jgi:hypothetical protein
MYNGKDESEANVKKLNCWKYMSILPAVNIFPAPDKTTTLHSLSVAILLKHVTISLVIKQIKAEVNCTVHKKISTPHIY